VEIAWWLLKANVEKKPLHKLLGGTCPVVDAGIAHGIKENLDMLMQAIQKGIDLGYKRTKLKFSRGWGLEMLKPARANFPKHTFHIDCNSSLSLDDLPMFKEVDKLGLAMIEQPLPHDALIAHRKLQAQLQTPICLDESIKSVRDLRLAIELKSCRYVNIKHGRVGGLQSALDIHNLARDHGIPAWKGGLHDDHAADLGGHHHHNRGQNVGNDVAEDDPEVAGAGNPRGDDERFLAEGQNFTPGRARLPDPVG
jgi:O-succinylbenzoate synthase